MGVFLSFEFFSIFLKHENVRNYKNNEIIITNLKKKRLKFELDLRIRGVI